VGAEVDDCGRRRGCDSGELAHLVHDHRVGRRGLPGGLQKTFQSFGAPATWIRTNYAGDVARVRGRVDLRRLLLDKRFDALDRDMAAFFHQLETSFV